MPRTTIAGMNALHGNAVHIRLNKLQSAKDIVDLAKAMSNLSKLPLAKADALCQYVCE